MASTNQNKRNSVKAISVSIGIVTLVALTGYLIAQIINADHLPPKLYVSTIHNSRANVYKLEIENSGDQTAKEVAIHIQVQRRDSVMGAIILSIPYVPAKSTKNAIVSLDNNWQSVDTLEVVSINFQIP